MWLLQAIPVIGKLFDTVSSVTNKLTDARIAARTAQSEDEKTAAAERVASLEARLGFMKAQQASPLGWLFNVVQALIGVAVALLVWKLLVYDKALGQWTSGHTDPLGEDLWDLMKLVLGFYFITSWLKH